MYDIQYKIIETSTPYYKEYLVIRDTPPVIIKIPTDDGKTGKGTGGEPGTTGGTNPPSGPTKPEPGDGIESDSDSPGYDDEYGDKAPTTFGGKNPTDRQHPDGEAKQGKAEGDYFGVFKDLPDTKEYWEENWDLINHLVNDLGWTIEQGSGTFSINPPTRETDDDSSNTDDSNWTDNGDGTSTVTLGDGTEVTITDADDPRNQDDE